MGTGQAQAMKSPQQWLNQLDNAHCGHTACCSCERCKHGQETFLLESDIAAIQADALDAANACVIVDGNPELAKLKILALIKLKLGL